MGGALWIVGYMHAISIKSTLKWGGLWLAFVALAMSVIFFVWGEPATGVELLTGVFLSLSGGLFVGFRALKWARGTSSLAGLGVAILISVGFLTWLALSVKDSPSPGSFNYDENGHMVPLIPKK